MLSPREFAELITVIQTTRDEGPKPEVRRAERVAHECRVTITLGNHEDAGPPYLVHLKDISARGMSFLHTDHLPQGTPFVVRLDAPGGDAVSILATVVHSREMDKRTFQIGAEFTCAPGITGRAGAG